METNLFWGLMWVQITAVLCLAAFRLSHAAAPQLRVVCQTLFYLSLASVGLGVLYALACEASCWVVPASSLAMLTIVGICEPAERAVGSESWNPEA